MHDSTIVQAAVRRRRLVRMVRAAVAAGLAAGLVVGFGSWASADRHHVATAGVLVTPVAPSSIYRDHRLPTGGLDDARAGAVAAARLLSTSSVAEPAAVRLRLSQAQALRAVGADVDEAGLIRVHGRARRPERAAQIANAFAAALVERRNERFQAKTLDLVRRHERELAGLGGGADREREEAVRRRIVELRSLLGTVDPSIELAGSAVPGAERRGTSVAEAVALGALVGLLVAAAAAGLALRRAAPQPSAVRSPAHSDPPPAPRAPAPQAPPAPVTKEPRESPPAPDGAYSVEILDRLVSARGRDDPDAAVELRQYLVSLRPYAGSDGLLPRRFDALVEDVFADVLPARG